MRNLSTGHVQIQCARRRRRRRTSGARFTARAGILLAAVGALLAAAQGAGAVIAGPNGKIVFTSGRNDGLTPFDDAHAQLWVMAKAGATPVRVTANAAIQHRHASWSPDRTKLVYSAGIGGDFDIYILDLTRPLSATNPTDVTPVPGVADDRPSWSPDGTRIAYQSKAGTNPAQIVIQSVTDGSQTVLTQPVGTGDAGKPVWSADSKTIFYSLVVATSPAVDDDIYRKAADDTGVATPVVTGPTDDYQPAISPDGQSLCFTRGAFGTTMATVQRSTVTGTNVTTIANSGLGDYNCAWSPDGTEIAYVQGIFANGDLMVKHSDGAGSPTPLVQNVSGRFDGNPEWTRNPSPTCQDQTVQVGFNVPATIPLGCVDPPPENDPLTRSIVSRPSHGSLGNIIGNAIVYTPARNFSGTDQFTFKANDGTSDSSVATVRLTIARDTPATISSLTVKPSRWRLGSRLPQISAKRAPIGTTISFRLSEPAKVKLTFARTTSGRKVGGRCVVPRPSNRSRPRCTRLLAAGQLSVNARAGVTRIRFQGRLSRTRGLAVGTYLLTVGATDAAGTRSRARTASFTIVTR
jgi:Tol biopolymer transport system component